MAGGEKILKGGQQVAYASGKGQVGTDKQAPLKKISEHF
jgi:hypothetical protein